MTFEEDSAAGAFGPVVREQKIKNLTAYPLLISIKITFQ
jgi:hypothetical protein